MKYIAILKDKYGSSNVLFGSDTKERLVRQVEEQYKDDIISSSCNVYELDGDEWIEIVAVPWIGNDQCSLPDDFEHECELLPVAASELTADPIWIVCDHDIAIPDAAYSTLLSDDRVVVSEDDSTLIFADSEELVHAKWLVENGYAVYVPRFYGAYMSREAADRAVKARSYALTKPQIRCESLVYSDPALKWLGRKLQQKKEK